MIFIKRFLLLCAVFFAALFLSSCQKKDDAGDLIVFDNENPYAIFPNVEWALITEPYVGFHEADNRSSATNSYCREGEILQIQGFSINEEKEQWYLFDRGWVISTSLKVYKNRYKAETAKLEAEKASKNKSR